MRNKKVKSFNKVKQFLPKDMPYRLYEVKQHAPRSFLVTDKEGNTQTMLQPMLQVRLHERCIRKKKKKFKVELRKG